MQILETRRLSREIPSPLVMGAIIALGLILLSLALMVVRGFDEARDLRREVVRSYETRSELQHILSLHQDLETAQRGYQLTNNANFLGPHTAASSQIDTAFARLDGNLLAHSPLRQHLGDLRRFSREKRAFVDEIIGLVKQGDTADAQRLVAAGHGKEVMDALRAEIGEMDAAERKQLLIRTERADAALLRVQRLNLAVKSALFLVLAFAIWFAARSFAQGKAALRRMEDLSRRQEAILDGATDGMIVLNASGSIESLNPAAAAMYGYERDELVRRDIGTLFEIAPDRGMVETFLKRLSARGSTGSNQVQEFVAARKNGETFPTEVTVSPIYLADKTVFLAVIRDISDRKQIEQMKSEFVSTVSHELRTPLTSIAGSLGLVTGGAAGDVPDRALRMIEIAKSNCTRLVRLINDILDIEKIESGKMRFDVKPLPLGTFLDQAVQANRGFAAEYGVSVTLEPVSAEAEIMADEDRLMQVVTNLLSNAAKFSPKGEDIRVSVRALDRRYRISVADHGPGISEEFRQRIFEKFAQADSSTSRQKGGTGLGLSIVREIVNRMRGSVSFESEPGRGTVFHVDLPAAPTLVAEPERIVLPAACAQGPELHVLHVDDDPDMLRVVSGVFDGMANVRSTPSLDEARAAILRMHFDAVVLDIGMEEGSGLELVPLLRRNGSRTPIVVFTAQDTTVDQMEGVDAVLVKSRATLDNLVEQVCALANRGRDKQEQA